MIDIRPFQGTPDELSQFVISVWKRAYEARMTFPLWSGDYLNWQLNLDGRSTPYVSAAYDQSRLVGVIAGSAYEFNTQADPVPGLISSWLSIDPEARGQGLVDRLKAAQAQQHREAGGKLILAYRYFGSKYSLSRKPRAGELASGEWAVRKVGFWVRILDARRAANWYVERATGVMTRLSGPFLRTPRPATGSFIIREFQSNDLSQCLELVNAENRGRFAIHWSNDTLGRLLTGFGQCLVCERDGAVQGLIAFHAMPFVGLTVEPVGIIDVFAHTRLNSREQRSLMNAVLQRMQSSGAALCLKQRTGDCPMATMLATGFIPWLPHSWQAVRWLDSVKALPLNGPQCVLWR